MLWSGYEADERTVPASARVCARVCCCLRLVMLLSTSRKYLIKSLTKLFFSCIMSIEKGKTSNGYAISSTIIQ